MTSLSDTLTVGLVLVLLFGSIALYLYTRIQQSEQKISLLESILLDLKMSSEIKSYSELPAETNIEKDLVDNTEQTDNNYQPFNEIDDDDEVYPGAVVGTSSPIRSLSPVPSENNENSDNNDSDVNEYKNVIAEAVKVEEKDESNTKVSVNYESMTLKELQALAKTRGISGAGSMKKNPIIEALKTSDRIPSNPEPGSSISMNNSFLETSSPFQTTEEAQ